jgi:bis(5'-nucleosyl)-tetraphosphatase (symmetrical)
MRWIVGDIQGCAREFERLLQAIRFDPREDDLWSLGDLINRGPDSLEVLRIWRSIGGRSLIGNHEINTLLALSGRRPRKMGRLAELFRAPDVDELMAQLRNLPVLVHLPAVERGPDAWIVHAGLDPRWTDLHGTSALLNTGPHDDDWLERADVRFATGVRCCTEDGEQCEHSGPPEECPPPYRPWDALYRGETLVVHGHWAMRGYYRTARTMGLDSGCVYGGSLTAWCQEEDRIVQIPSRHPA